MSTVAYKVPKSSSHAFHIIISFGSVTKRGWNVSVERFFFSPLFFLFAVSRLETLYEIHYSGNARSRKHHFTVTEYELGSYRVNTLQLYKLVAALDEVSTQGVPILKFEAAHRAPPPINRTYSNSDSCDLSSNNLKLFRYSSLFNCFFSPRQHLAPYRFWRTIVLLLLSLSLSQFFKISSGQDRSNCGFGFMLYVWGSFSETIERVCCVMRFCSDAEDHSLRVWDEKW